MHEYCSFSEYGDLRTLEQSVKAYLQEAPEKDAIAEKARNSYSKEEMCREYIKLYRDLCER